MRRFVINIPNRSLIFLKFATKGGLFLFLAVFAINSVTMGMEDKLNFSKDRIVNRCLFETVSDKGTILGSIQLPCDSIDSTKVMYQSILGDLPFVSQKVYPLAVYLKKGNRISNFITFYDSEQKAYYLSFLEKNTSKVVADYYMSKINSALSDKVSSVNYVEPLNGTAVNKIIIIGLLFQILFVTKFLIQLWSLVKNEVTEVSIDEDKKKLIALNKGIFKTEKVYDLALIDSVFIKKQYSLILWNFSIFHNFAFVISYNGKTERISHYFYDEYWGVKNNTVIDHYRWLENTINSQIELTKGSMIVDQETV